MNKWYFLSINLLPAYRKKVLLFLLAVFAVYYNLSSQVYNYDPIRHSNFEVNPCYLASGENYRTLQFIHHSSFSPEAPLQYSSVRYSLPDRSNFFGYGILISNTYHGNNINYTSAGIAAGYSTVLLNTINFRLGALYKTNYVIAPPGNFEYGDFIKDTIETQKSKHKINHGLNLSFDFASDANRFYLNGGVLNYWPVTQQNQFPIYYYLNLGDLGRLLSDRVFELNYTMFIKKQTVKISYSNYFTLLFKFNITRNSALRYGARFGIAENEHFQFNPAVNYYIRLHKKNSFGFQLMFDLTFKNNNNSNTYPPGGQISLTYAF